MPDANGRFKGIAVPRIPWHEPDVVQWDDDETHRRMHREFVAAVRRRSEPPEERSDDGRSDSV